MILKTLLAYSLACIFLISTCAQQYKPEIDVPRLFYEVSDTTCEMIDLHLDEYAQAVRQESATQAHIIAYGGRTDSPGKILRYVNYVKTHLTDSLGNDFRSVSVINGGYRDHLSIELWILPAGFSGPTPTDSAREVTRQDDVPYKFDETEASIMEYNEESYLSFGLLCTLPYPEWGEFFRLLRDEPNLRGHIIIYVGHSESPQHAEKIERFLRDDLTKDHPTQVEALTMVYGGKREWSQIEIWVLSKEGRNPKPSAEPRAPSRLS